MSESDRRDFLKRSAAATAGVACAGLLSCAGCKAAGPAPTGPSPAPAARGGGGAAGPIDAGPLDQLLGGPAVNAAFVRRGHFVLVRQDQRLYALSSLCTHRACDVKPSTANGATELYCPCHGAEFDLQGQVTHGPAKLPLKRLAISLDAKRHVIVDGSRQFDAGDRDNPEAFVSL